MSSLSSELLFLDDLCDRFESQLREAINPVSIPQFLAENVLRNEISKNRLIHALLLVEWDFLREQTLEPDLQGYLELDLISRRELQKLFFRWEKSRNETTLFENYQLVSQLGQGRFGTVWKAIELESGQPVAIKIAHPSLIENCDQFLHESRAALNLRHPHIANLIKSGEWKSRPFIVREYIEGQTLSELFRERSLTPTESAEMAE